MDQIDKGESDVIPPEVLDLLRFMCATWSKIDRFVYQHCDCDALEHYPVIQGTRNQIQLQRIGEQPHDTANISKAAEWMQQIANGNALHTDAVGDAGLTVTVFDDFFKE